MPGLFAQNSGEPQGTLGAILSCSAETSTRRIDKAVRNHEARKRNRIPEPPLWAAPEMARTARDDPQRGSNFAPCSVVSCEQRRTLGALPLEDAFPPWFRDETLPLLEQPDPVAQRALARRAVVTAMMAYATER